jgi:hypothetical protein
MEGVHCSFVIHMARPGERDKAWTHGMAENRAVGVVDLRVGRQLLRKAVSFWLLCLSVMTDHVIWDRLSSHDDKLLIVPAECGFIGTGNKDAVGLARESSSPSMMGFAHCLLRRGGPSLERNGIVLNSTQDSARPVMDQFSIPDDSRTLPC